MTIASIASGNEPDIEFFETRIRPVLMTECFRCHGGDETNEGLRVDTRAALVAGGNRGPAVIPGDSSGSLLIRALRHEDDQLRMPPENRLAPHVVADLEHWIEAGAVWPESSAVSAEPHWAFRPFARTAPPVDGTGWSDGIIDRHLMAEWIRHDVVPVQDADRRTLIRRLSFDLWGLPPTPEQIAAFVADRTPTAYQQLVEQMLASPHYGERWGRHWMDLIRYADTAGDNADYPIPEVIRYRDYIISALNQDLPYDQFVREQLAGDLLARSAPRNQYERLVGATGFLALSRRYGTAPYELWHLTLEDTIDTVGRVFLGLSLRCARCHDHKYDPVTTRDYYALYGIFASTQFPWAGGEEFQSKNTPRMHFVGHRPRTECEAAWQVFEQEVVEKQAEVKKTDDANLMKRRQAELNQLQRRGLPDSVAGLYAVSDATPTHVPIHLKGNPDQPGDVIPRSVPTLGMVPAAQIPENESGRRQLADWICRADHPLTARVIVNHLWQHHFGQGLVITPNHFGRRGAAPTHPALLDYLASRLIEEDWSLKAIQREIVLARVYRLSSMGDDGNGARDPDNRLYWRANRRRLDAESLRDAILFVSQEIDIRRGGTHPFPDIGSWNWTQHNPFRDVYPSRHRSVFLMTQRLQRHPFLALFDGPDTNTTTPERTSSTVPPQALFFLNNPWFIRQAEGFAMQLLDQSQSPAERIFRAYEGAFGRPPDADELNHALHFVGDYLQTASHLSAPQDAERRAWIAFTKTLLASSEFIYVD